MVKNNNKGDSACAADITPLVSVVIPVFNHGRYIVDCLESVFSQDYPRIELLVLDDGSSDDSFDRAWEWAKLHSSRFERCIIDRQQNQGICKTLNKLIIQSKGAYIQALASDDMLVAGALKKLVSFHREHCQPDELLFTNVALIDSEGQAVSDNVMQYLKKDEAAIAGNANLLKLEVLLRWFLPYPHQFYPRKFYDLVGGYDESLKFEDVYFALWALALDKARYAPVVAKHYRLRAGSTITPGLDEQTISAIPTRKKVARHMKLFDRVLVNIMNFRDAQNNKAIRAMTGKFISLIYRIMSYWYLYGPNTRKAAATHFRN